MVIGALTIVLRLHHTQSLKDKRGVVKRILERTRETFHIAVAEVADHDAIGRAKLAFVAVGNDGRVMNSVMDRVFDYVEGLQLAEIADSSIDVFTADGED